MAVANIIWIYIYLAYCFSSNVSAGYVEDVYHDEVGIIHGDRVKITEVPFYAIIWNNKRQLLVGGASIVHEQFVVTAAARVKFISRNTSRPLADYVIKLGTDNFYHGDIYEIENGFWHPKHNFKTHDYDVGIIKLKTKLKLSPTVQTIAMADSSLVFKKGDVFDTLGFGYTEKEKTSKFLLKVDVPYMERDECAKYEKGNLTERMICAGNHGKDYKGPSVGDGGGALRFKNHLLGIVSWTTELRDTPIVFAFVPALRDYIDKTIKDNL